MIAYKNLDRQTVESHFADFDAKRGNSEYKLLLGKLVVWAEQSREAGTLKKFMLREFGVVLERHAYSCAKLFRAIHTGKLPGVSEANYDTLVQNDVLRVSPLIGKVPPDQIAEMLLTGIDGRTRFQRKSKDPNFPRAGNVYILVSSANPLLTKIGRTLLDPYIRARELSRGAGVTSELVVVWHERVSDCVAVETALHHRLKAKKHDQGGDEWFRVTPKEAIPVLIGLAQRYSLPPTGTPPPTGPKHTARDLLNEL